MAAATAGDSPFDRSYEGSTEVVNGVRLDVDAWLLRQSADEDTRQRAALVVSELASNAVQASPWRPFAIAMRRVRDDCVTIVVSNRAERPHIPPRSEWRNTDVSAPGGRGLAIADAVCERVDVSIAADGTVTVVADLGATFR